MSNEEQWRSNLTVHDRLVIFSSLPIAVFPALNVDDYYINNCQITIGEDQDSHFCSGSFSVTKFEFVKSENEHNGYKKKLKVKIALWFLFVILISMFMPRRNYVGIEKNYTFRDELQSNSAF